MNRYLSLLVMALILSSTFADAADDRMDVMAVVDSFFSDMTLKNIEGMRRIMTEDGVLYGYREGAGEPSTFSLTHAAYLENLAAGEGVPVERIWSPTVDIHGRIAVVWTPYDFHRDGTFSHCGMNMFSLLKGADGWKITGVVFSVQSENCADSPLGPFEGGAPE